MSSDNVKRLFLATGGLATAIVAVTLAGALRILTVVPDGEGELEAWLAAGVLLAGRGGGQSQRCRLNTV